MALTKVTPSMIEGSNNNQFTFAMTEGMYYNVLDYGADNTGATSSTAAIQAAIEAAQDTAKPVYIPAGTYLVDDTITVYNGTQLLGDTNFSYGAGYARPVNATTISFEPATAKPLFDYEWKTAPAPGFVFHTSIKNIYAIGNDPSTADYGLKLNGVIYANFENLCFENFGVGVYCYGTINNRFENLFIQSCGTSCVEYAGVNETTDVWEQCTFFSAPVGVQFKNVSVSIRFSNCLWEQITTYGMDIPTMCQTISVTDAYCEDVPYGVSPASDSCMFRVGLYTGSSLSDVNNHLIVSGGTFNGKNGGIAGQLFNVGYCWGILVNGIVANRWPQIFTVDGTNTKSNSITVHGLQGITWTTFTNDSSKISGSFPNGVLNSGQYDSSYAGNALTADYGTFTYIATSQVNPPSVGFYPSTDNAKTLGLSNLRWSVVYAGTGTINTSDEREKQDFNDLTEAEKQAALGIKSLLKSFKFKDAVAKKGDKARIHFGVAAQQVAEVFKTVGLNPDDYALFCYDEWEAEDAVINEDGEVISPAIEAGNRYGIRYDELLAFVIAAL